MVLTLRGFKYIRDSFRKIVEICDRKEVDVICSCCRSKVISSTWSAIISGLAGIEIILDELFELGTQKHQMVDVIKKRWNKWREILTLLEKLKPIITIFLSLDNFLYTRSIKSTEIYITLERTTFDNKSDDFTVRIAKEFEEIKKLLEVGFEFVCEKKDLVFLRKRK